LGGKMKDLLTDEEIKGAVQQLHNEMFPYLADALQEWEAIAKAQLAKLLSLIPDIEAVKREERERIIKYLRFRYSHTDIVNAMTRDIHISFHLPEDWQQALREA